ncbi:hypothetical protein LY90DRAFT_676503 [Neocallimastix californiae]|uniref:G-protein coupled receptors family 3 profile domain-containing protein n=1 Tax=Neocallimastix californiae TaxID=1754190 RepID=A0A1Y2AED2_9FUNG|nr:hypothetical protein LY90DRAFT_676503 [Neocallimastix californiae]|eukprot:ORY20938.1 hypothetical protein LY90DRAFT_676503 [Neocallimastix californiae]
MNCKIKVFQIIYIYLIINVIFLCNYVFSKTENEKETIVVKFLKQNPDIYVPEVENEELKLMNEYLSEKRKDKETKVIIDFEYFYYDDYQLDSPNQLMMMFKNSTTDIIVMEDMFLFWEVSNIYSYMSMMDFDLFIDFYDKYFLDLTKYFDNNKDFYQFNDKKFLKDGTIKNKLYAIPYELDYDVLFYQNELFNKEELNLMKSLNWHDFIKRTEFSKLNSKTPINIYFLNYEDILNYFVEYISGYFNLSQEKNEHFYKALYTKEAKKRYEEFRNIMYNPLNITSTIYSNYPLEDNLISFLNGDYSFFKGKASFQYFMKYFGFTNVSFILPPKDYTVLNKKYLVINKKSTIDPSILVEIVQHFTSKEWQYIRAQYFNKVPTYDINQYSTDSFIKDYFDRNPSINSTLNEMNPIHIKDVFLSKFSAPFIEIRYVFSYAILQFLLNFNFTVDYFTDIIENIYILKYYQDKSSIYLYLNYIFIIIFLFICLVMVHSLNRYHNYYVIRMMSPRLCILVCFGFIFNLILKSFESVLDTVIKCKIGYIVELISMNLYYIPTILILFRIYCIYTGKLSTKIKLNDKNMLLYVFIILLTLTTFVFILFLFIKISVYSGSSIIKSRHPYYYSKGLDYYGYGFYVYFSIIINSNENYMLYSFLINLGYIVTYTACIFFLVGEKIIKIKRNPDDSYLLNGEEKELETKVLKNKINKNKELKFVMTTVVYDDNNNSSKNESSVSDTFITKNYSYSSDITKN